MTCLLLTAALPQFELGIIWSAEPTAQSPSPAPSIDGVLVLRDGGVLTGLISRSADRYLVTQAGAEINLAVAEVIFVGRTLEDAYEARRRTVEPPGADAHLALAEWCLRYSLFPQAAQEVLAARALDPRHPHLALIERRLAVLSQPAPARPAERSATAPQPPPAHGPDHLSSIADELPFGAVELFTRRVQPMLVNNCTTTGCHGLGGPQSFQLDRALLHGMANRRSTTTNLAATLALIDRDRPQDSPLLTIPRRDHGGMDHPIFGPRQDRLFQQLVEWAVLVTSSADVPATPPDTIDGEVTAAPAATERPSKGWREPVKRVVYEDDGTIMVPSATQRPRATLRHGVKLQPWQPSDPFDSEIFNRQTAQQNAASSQED